MITALVVLVSVLVILGAAMLTTTLLTLAALGRLRAALPEGDE